MPAEPPLVARGLRRVFGDRVAVHGLDLEVQGGETLALLGPNGAGKSTTVAMLTTLLAPSGGEARVGGHDLAREPARVRARIGVVFQGPSLEPHLGAERNLRLHAELYGMGGAEARRRVPELLAQAGLADRAAEPVWRLSGGMRRRLELARAVLHRPAVLFLDEPTTGLDPQARRAAWALLERAQDDLGMAVLLTTHDMHEADRLADRVAILDQGRLAAVGAPEHLKAGVGEELVCLRFRSGHAALQGRLEALPGVRSVAWRGAEALVHVERVERALPGVLQLVARRGALLDEMDVRRPTLEDVFLARTGHALRGEP